MRLDSAQPPRVNKVLPNIGNSQSFYTDLTHPVIFPILKRIYQQKKRNNNCYSIFKTRQKEATNKAAYCIKTRLHPA